MLTQSTQLPDLTYEEIAEAEEYRRSFKLFAQAAWQVIEPGTPLLWNWHLDVIADHLQAVYERKIKRLAITLAPGHAKSSFISVLFPSWCWLNNPYLRFLCASHSIDLSTRDNKNRRDLMESDWFQARYGHLFKFSTSQNVKSFFENDKRGYMMATAVRSSGTGKRADFSLIDDPNNAMAGLADIEATKDWFGKTWMSRLNDQENGPMIAVGQRLDEKDLIAHILELGWEHLNLPEEYEPGMESQTSLGKYDIRTEEGELLWKEKFPKEALDKLKRGLGPLHYSAQYQQRPVPAGGNIYEKRNARYFTIDWITETYLLETPRGIKAVPMSDCWKFCTVDPAISEKQSADWFVAAAYAVTPWRDLLLLDILREHFTLPEQGEQIVLYHYKHGFQLWAVESVAFSAGIIQLALTKGVPAQPFKVHTDKVIRSGTASIWDRSGKFYALKNANWLFDYEKEIYTFPKAAKDDQADTKSMAAIVVCSAIGPGIWNPDDTSFKADTSEPIEAILDAEQIAAEQAKQQEEAKAEQPVDPFQWVDSHLKGDW